MVRLSRVALWGGLAGTALLGACGSDEGSGSGGSGGSGGSAVFGGSSGSGGAAGSSGSAGSAGSAGSDGGLGGSAGSGGCDPGASDSVGDDIDQNCDGVDGVDADGDGVPSTDSGGTDCNDGDPSVFPGASETWLLELIAIDYAALCGGAFSSCNSSPTPSALVVDGAGSFHLALRAPGYPFDLTYVANTGGAWWFEKISGLDGNGPKLAVGPAGQRHVAFSVDNFATRVYVASSDASTGPWTSKSIGSINDMKINERIATDAAGVVHVVATDENQSAGGGGISPNDLFYATSQDDFAVTQISLPGTEKLFGLSLAVSAAGAAHAAWHDAGTTTFSAPADPRMRYAALASGIAETIDEDGASGPTSIALDASDEPVISYWKTSGSSVSLSVARRTAGVWSSETVLTAAGSRGAPIAFGAGAVHICSVDDAGALAYLSRADGAASWASETIVPSVYPLCHIVFDAVSAKPHIALTLNSRMFKATPSGSPGVDRNCDGSDD